MRQIEGEVEVGLAGRRHDEHHLVLWCRQGSVAIRCAGSGGRRAGVHDVVAGQALLVPAGVVHDVGLRPGSVAHPILLPAGAPIVTTPGVTRVDSSMAAALMGLVVSGDSELRPAPSSIDARTESVERALTGGPWEPPPPVTAFIPWVTNPPGTHVLLQAVLGDSTVTLRSDDGTESVVEVPQHMALSVPPGLAHRVVTGPDAVGLPVFHDQPASAGEDLELHRLTPDLRMLAARQYMASTSALRPDGWDDSALAEALRQSSHRTVVARPATVSSLVDRVREEILRDPGIRLAVDEWARSAGCSRRTLERDFRRRVGDSLLSWRNGVRAARAAELLEEGHQAKWVARRLGFTHASAFTRSFRGAHGVTPRDYRERARAS